MSEDRAKGELDEGRAAGVDLTLVDEMLRVSPAERLRQNDRRRRRRVHVAAAGVLFLSLALATPARAQPAPAFAEPSAGKAASAAGRSYQAPDKEPAHDPGAHSHDGFYLRLQLGGGYTSLSTRVGAAGVSISGKSLGLGVALGGAVTSHLIVYGALVEDVAFNPTNTNNVSGATSNGLGTIEVLSFGGGIKGAGAIGIGAGTAYYLDSNVFVAGSLLGSRLSVSQDGGAVGKSDWGLTLEGLVGREWWVSDNWGLGLAGQVLLGAMKDGAFGDMNAPTWRMAAFSVLFSATFN